MFKEFQSKQNETTPIATGNEERNNINITIQRFRGNVCYYAKVS